MKNSTIEAILNDFRDALGKDFDKYYNHVYRVYYLSCCFDDNEVNKEKYAIAAAFHDLGIWTADTFDYIDPSLELAKRYLETVQKVEWAEEISLMIEMHHKIRPYKERYETSVESFRKADWIDLSLGLLQFGLPRKTYHNYLRPNFPYKGFHPFLVKKSLQNLLKNPRKPLPMFRW